MKETESSLPVELARRAIEHYLAHRRRIPAPHPLPQEMAGQAGAFVSLHRKDGLLRGCIGTIESAQPNLAEEIIQNAISAATRDPRFPPVRLDEVANLSISVDVLMPPEKVDSLADLDPGRYGAIVRSGYRRGLLLPALEGVDSAETQVAICMDKAGISPDEPVELYRFEVKRYH